MCGSLLKIIILIKRNYRSSDCKSVVGLLWGKEYKAVTTGSMVSNQEVLSGNQRSKGDDGDGKRPVYRTAVVALGTGE